MMHSDNKWQIIPLKDQRLKSRYFRLKSLIILWAFSGLLGVYLFALFDPSIGEKSRNKQSVSVAISQLQSAQPAPLLHMVKKDTLKKDEKSIQKVLESLRIRTETFVLAQLGSTQAQTNFLYSTSQEFYDLISSVFRSDETDLLPSEPLLEEKNIDSSDAQLPFNSYFQPFKNKNNSSQIFLGLLKPDPDSFGDNIL